MSIEWLDHTADVGFRSGGNTVEEAFTEAAHALFSLMFAIDTIAPETKATFNISAMTLPGLLVEWLSELLAQKELTGLVFSQFDIALSGDDEAGFRACGRAFGEILDRMRHQPATEVKGISYLGLSVVECKGNWTAQVIVDV